MKTKIYLITNYSREKDILLLERVYNKHTYIAGEGFTGNVFSFCTEHDSSLDIDFYWSPLPMVCYNNAVFVGYL